MALEKSNYGSRLEFKRSKVKVKVTENEQYNVQRKTQIITGPFYTYRRIHFTSENASFCDIRQ